MVLQIFTIKITSNIFNNLSVRKGMLFKAIKKKERWVCITPANNSLTEIEEYQATVENIREINL